MREGVAMGDCTPIKPPESIPETTASVGIVKVGMDGKSSEAASGESNGGVDGCAKVDGRSENRGRGQDGEG